MRKGIATLLRDYYRLRSRADDGEFDTAVMLADLMGAINGDILTVRQRQYIALYFFVGLTYAEIAEITYTANQSRVSDGIYTALQRLGEVHDGSAERYKQQPAEDFSKYDGDVYRWLDAIANGAPIGEPPRSVVISIAELLCKNDEESAELLRQAMGGSLPEILTEVEEYPHYSDSQLRWLDRRMSFVPEVFPEGDVVGSKRVVPRYAVDESDEENDDGEHITRTIQQTGRRKMFKLRGN